MEFCLTFEHHQAKLAEHLKETKSIFIHSRYFHAMYPTNLVVLETLYL